MGNGFKLAPTAALSEQLSTLSKHAFHTYVQVQNNSLSSPAGRITGVGSAAKGHADSNINVVSAKDSTLQPTVPNKEGQHHKTQEAKTTLEQHCQHPPTRLLAAQTAPTQIHNLGHSNITTQVNAEVLKKLLLGYQNKKYLIDCFEHGFHLGYVGPRNSKSATNLKSCREHPETVMGKITSDISAKRVKDSFKETTFQELKISQIGIVPKKAPGQYRLIHHLSCPNGTSVNDFVGPAFASVKYASFYDAVEFLVKLGP